MAAIHPPQAPLPVASSTQPWRTHTEPLGLPALPNKPSISPQRQTAMQGNPDPDTNKFSGPDAARAGEQPSWQRTSRTRLERLDPRRQQDPTTPMPWYPAGKSWEEMRAEVYGVETEEQGDGDAGTEKNGGNGKEAAPEFQDVELRSRSPSPWPQKKTGEDEEWVELDFLDSAPPTSIRDRKRGGYGDGKSNARASQQRKISPENSANPNINPLRRWGFTDSALAAVRREAAGEDIDPYTHLPRKPRWSWFGGRGCKK